MKTKKLTALLLTVLLIFSAVQGVFAEDTALRAFSVTFDRSDLMDGELNATVVVQRLGGDEDEAVVSLGYYKADGTLMDFAAEICGLEAISMVPGLAGGTAALSLEIPSDVETGDYARVIVMSKTSLAPYTANGETTVYCDKSIYEPVESEYTDIYERYYTLDSENGSIAMDGSEVTVAETGTSFRLKNMGEGYVAFVDSTSDGENRRLDYDSESETLGRRLYGYGGTSMLWKLTPSGDKYFIEHYSGGYLAIENGEAVLSETPQEFRLTFAKESPFTLMTSLEGYELLSEEEKQRVIEIYTSVGAEIFPQGSNSSSILDTAEAVFSQLYADRDSLTAEQQRDRILEAVKTPPRYNSGETNEINAVNINSLPNGNAEIAQTAPVKESIEIWDIGYGEYNRIDVTYTGYGKTQTVKFYYNESGETNVQTAIEALARFPYEYRQFLEQVNVYVPTETFSYNCDGPILTVRVSDGTNVETMARNIAHELGHSIDFCLNGDRNNEAMHLCQSSEWQQAIADDMAAVSQYGTTNAYEGFAEFARLYFQSYGSRDRQLGVQQLFPNRYRLFTGYLEQLGMESLY